jgi:COPII coat assembly protein SEC16
MESATYPSWNPALRPNTAAEIPPTSIASLSEESSSCHQEPSQHISELSMANDGVNQEKHPEEHVEHAWVDGLEDSQEVDLAWSIEENAEGLDLNTPLQNSAQIKGQHEESEHLPMDGGLDWATTEEMHDGNQDSFDFTQHTQEIAEIAPASSKPVDSPQRNEFDWDTIGTTINDESFNFGQSEEPALESGTPHFTSSVSADTAFPGQEGENSAVFDMGPSAAPSNLESAEELPVTHHQESTIDWAAADGDDFDISDKEAPQQVVLDHQAMIDSTDSAIAWDNSLEDHQDTFDFGGEKGDFSSLNAVDSPVVEQPKQTEAAPQDDVSALWDSLGDEDFLAEVSQPAGGSNFPDFGNDEDGFLDDVTPPQHVENQSEPHVSSTMGLPSQTSTASRYAPAGTVPTSEPKQQTNDYVLPGPQFTDFTQLSQPNTQTTISRAAAPPIGYQSVPPARPDLAPSAQSFADKAKGGYHSPYDLPDDFSKPRKRLGPAGKSPWGAQVAPPPRSASLPLGAMPTATSFAPKPVTPPSSSYTTTAPPAAPPSYQPQVTSAPVRPPSSGSFFEDLPMAPRQRTTTPSGRYTPQTQHVQPPLQTGPPIANQALPAVPPHSQTAPSSLPTQPSLVPHFQPPEKLHPYADDVHGNLRSATIPAPISNRYSPAPGSLPAKPAAGPPPAVTSTRYSPAPASKPLPAINQRHTSEPPPLQSRPPFAPRTSSPLTYHALSQEVQDEPQGIPPPVPPKLEHHSSRLSGFGGQAHLEPVAENEASTGPSHAAMAAAVAFGSTREMTPPPPRSSRSSLSSSPRKRSNYAPAATTNEPTSFVPPKRSQTSSPGSGLATLKAPINRPASAQDMMSPTQPRGSLPFQPMASRVPEKDVMPPQDELANDPLQRWRGAPVFAWSGTGTMVTAFPSYTPRYIPGHPTPLMVARGGQFKLHHAMGIVSPAEHLSQFPGPVKKSKKKELVPWMKSAVEKLELRVKSLILNTGLAGFELIRMQERVMLWKVLTLLVEQDGILEGNPTVEEAVKNLFAVDTDGSTSIPGVEAANILPDAQTPKDLATLRSHLIKGEREQAVWYAVDQRLWGPALLIASTLSRDKWQQCVQELVRKEVRHKPLAALFQNFAGNWDESADELVSVSARAGFQMVNTTNTSANQDALSGLESWRETALLILSNRSPGDAQALAATGRLLATYGRFEAAHICFIFSKTNAFFGGADDPRSAFSLVGGDPKLLGLDFDGDLEAIILSEIYEYVLSILPTPVSPIPHLQAYKLYHAEVLAENGHQSEAQAYCETINTSIHSKTKGSPYYNVVLMQAVDDLMKRLSEAPADSTNGWRNMDKVSSSLWGKFNSFITGDDAETPPTGSGPASEAGQFQRLASDTPPMSTAASNTDLYSAYQSGASAAPPVNPRYAPSNQYAPRRAGEAAARSRYEPVAAASNQTRTSLESSRSSQEGRRSLEATSFSPKRVASVPAFGQVAQQQTNGHSNGLGVPVQSALDYRSHSASPYQMTPLSVSQNGTPDPSKPQPEPTTQDPSFGYTPSYSSQPTESLSLTQQGYASTSFDETPAHSQSYDNTPPRFSYDTPSSGYEPPSYRPYEPEAESEQKPDEPTGEKDDDPSKPKKKSFMDDDDDDDLIARAAALKASKKSDNDRAADEAFRKAAEADGSCFPFFSF